MIFLIAGDVPVIDLASNNVVKPHELVHTDDILLRDWMVLTGSRIFDKELGGLRQPAKEEVTCTESLL